MHYLETMKRSKLFQILLFLVMFPHVITARQHGETYEIKVMSYNIRLGSGKDGDNSWEYRKPATIELIKDQKPDIFGVQEALSYQLDYIRNLCKNYSSVGVGRDDGKSQGEHMSIYWNKKRIKMLDWGTFWLSETPETPSKGWDARYKRSATWALMKDKRSGKKFYFVNTHLDHRGKEAQKNGLKLIVDRIGTINPQGFPMILTGDFNINPDNPALEYLNAEMESARDVAEKSDWHNTFNGWSTIKTDRIIDYIYFKGFNKCTEYQTIIKQYLNIPFVSDHYPIYAILKF